MRMLAVIAFSLTCAACAAADRDGGVMTYDSLSEAAKACAAKDGRLVLSPGGDPQQMSNYACKRK